MFSISTNPNHPHASNRRSNTQNPDTAPVSQAEESQVAGESMTRQSSPGRDSIGDSLQISNRRESEAGQHVDELPPPYGLHEQDELYRPTQHPPAADASNHQHRDFERWLQRRYQQFVRNHPDETHNEEQFEAFLEGRLRHNAIGEGGPVRHSANRIQSNRINSRSHHPHASTDDGLPMLYGFPVLGSSNNFTRDLYAETLADDNPFSRGLNAMHSGHNSRRQMARPSVGARRPERRNP